MARPLRIEYADAYYHVTSRGNERKKIFRSDRDREKFIDYLKSATERYSAVIHAYCLMDNHYHLLIQTPAGNLSRIMRHINGAYTTYYNVKRKRFGHLFQGRYKAILIEADAYIQELSRYIHLNPVRAGMVETPERYKWTSYPAYVDKNKKPEWLNMDFILGLFSGRVSEARKQYRKFVESMVGIETESPFLNVFASTILGSTDFINEVRTKYLGNKKINRDLPDLKMFYDKPDLKVIIESVEKEIREDPILLKRVQLYICHQYSGQKLKDIGQHFGIGESGVSQASRRVAKQIEKDKKLGNKIEIILSRLNLSRM